MSSDRPRRLPALLVLALLAVLVPGVATGTASAAATVTLTPAAGPVGTTTTVTGSGFARRSGGSIVVGSRSVGVRTDSAGRFAVPVRVPPPASGATLVPVAAKVGRVSASTRFQVVPAGTVVPALRFGVATPDGLHGAPELDAVTALVGEAPKVVLSFADFTREADVAGLRAIAARGAVPMVTWEPWVAGGGVSQPSHALDRIAAGHFDAYLTRWGSALRDVGSPVLLRFAHEMNGNWYPWAEGVNGNGPGDYAAAWRHVHRVVTAAGARNVQWVWAPNVPYTGSVPLPGLYPGAEYVDVTALDGYNWGTASSWSSWQSPQTLLGPGLQQLRALAPGKQIIIAETASAELGGSKPDWNRALVAYLDAQRDVTALVWFHFAKETDWRINSTTASATALREALAARVRR